MENGVTLNQIMCEGVTWAGLSENRILYIWRLTFEFQKGNGVIYRQAE